MYCASMSSEMNFWLKKSIENEWTSGQPINPYRCLQLSGDFIMITYFSAKLITKL